MSDDFFAPPPFQPEAALAGLERELRALGLVKREGRFELRGKPVLRLEPGAGVMELHTAKRPAAAPEWTHRSARSAAELRRGLDELKARLARWDERDD